MTQSGPFRCINMRLVATVGGTDYTLSVVEGYDIQMGYEGGAEPYYGSRTRKHSAGSKTATFSITRWFYSDAGQENLLLDLFLNETEFTLTGDLIDNNGTPIATTEISLTQCRLYKYRPRTGAADDIIGEEASGEAINWTTDVHATP
jgi:hypothetical protein